ncbi:FecCD family ABC transporter permease [Dactylosporangium sucinum]|uniref:Iron ABC transporter permease n=1 Tax=Dactylosporangium sucinum TaxID=1424081 RepID=A0A917U484_9ACTN|nr:iron ABC transporter permease [Dactylosporangium sucinum]
MQVVHKGRWLVAAAGLLLGALAASLAIGARPLGPAEVWHGLTDASGAAATVVRELRLPRTALGLAVGAALGLAGALMQALTRNPLADPGLLGVNAGAAAAVVSAIAFLGVTDLIGYVWFAFAGAAVVSVGVWAVAGGRRAGPAGLALSGTAVTAALFAYVYAVQLLNTNSLDRMRFWTAGSLAAARPGTTTVVVPFIAAGILLTALLARSLNVLALGDDAARGLGAHPDRIRVLAALAIVLLCGAATAACGPIVFLGLMVPHLVRPITGPDLRWLLPFSAVLAPALLLVADVLGRVVARPGELQVGVVTAVVGGAFFLGVVQRRRA